MGALVKQDHQKMMVLFSVQCEMLHFKLTQQFSWSSILETINIIWILR